MFQYVISAIENLHFVYHLKIYGGLTSMIDFLKKHISKEKKSFLQKK